MAFGVMGIMGGRAEARPPGPEENISGGKSPNAEGWGFYLGCRWRERGVALHL
ncbi:MAG: hypothetical protein ACK4G3_06205 [bacterium]